MFGVFKLRQVGPSSTSTFKAVQTSMPPILGQIHSGPFPQGVPDIEARRILAARLALPSRLLHLAGARELSRRQFCIGFAINVR